MTVNPDVTASINRFLDQAATLTQDDWVAVYWRYVQDPSILRAERAFQNVATQDWIGRRIAMSAEEKAAEDKLLDETNVRITAICAVLPEDELDSDRGGHLRQRIVWVMSGTRLALRSVGLLRSAPKTLNAVRRFLSVFGELLAIPEFQ